MAQNKTSPAKAKAKTPAKPAASKSTKPAVRPASASKGASTTVAKNVNAAGSTIKKSLAVAKPSSSAASAKPVAKATVHKVDMSHTAAKKAEAVKPVATKPVVAAKPVAKPLPAPVKAAVAPVKPAAPVFKPAAPAVVKPVFAPPVRPAAPIAAKPVVAAAPVADAGPKKAVSSRHGFKTNEWIVYPAHGVGRIVAIDEQEIAGMALELFVITFEKDKLTLRVPTGKAQQVGMRKLAEDGEVRRAMETLKGKARIKRTMWSRRAQEFEAKINSGNLTSIAEVVRDLYRAENQPEQSYSERQLYEAALDRMAREIAAVDKIDERAASQRIVDVLSKSAKGRKAAGEEAAAAAAAEDDEAVQAA
jgi:CarD family transcriptional regulator